MIWSLLYSGLELLKIIHSGNEIHWLGFVYRFIVGKSATPFYYIVVLMQLKPDNSRFISVFCCHD